MPASRQRTPSPLSARVSRGLIIAHTNNHARSYLFHNCGRLWVHPVSSLRAARCSSMRRGAVLPIHRGTGLIDDLIWKNGRGLLLSAILSSIPASTSRCPRGKPRSAPASCP